MRSTSIDLTSPEVVSDPYPSLAQERARGPVAFHEASNRWLTFSHEAASAVLREKGLGRDWQDRGPAAYLEPFNLLHRYQLTWSDSDQHDRLRGLVEGAFHRGHIERLRPRVRELAAELLAETDPACFDMIADYAEPLPVLVIAELLGVPSPLVPQLREWSRAIVRMYEPVTPQPVVDAAVKAAEEFAGTIGELARERVREPRDDLLTDLVSTSSTTRGLTEGEVVATAVLLLNAGHEASVHVFGNGLVAMFRSRRKPSQEHIASCVEEMLRYDAALQLCERTATEQVKIAGVRIEPGERIAALIGAANRDPAVFDHPDDFLPNRDPNPHISFGAGAHFCLGASLARMELFESLSMLLRKRPLLHLVGEPEPRGAFVLRGYRHVTVGGLHG